MEIVYFTDIHGKGINPASRKDDYPQTVLDKLNWCMDYAVRVEAAAILIGGDLLDTPNVAEAYVRQMAKRLSCCPIPKYFVPGNHDIYGYNPETFQRTILGVVEASIKDMYLLGEEPYIIDDGTNRIALTGVPSHFDLDTEESKDKYLKTETVENAVNIRTMHSMLVEKPSIFKHTLVKDVIHDMEADIILNGHEHPGYGPIFENGKMCCNPGALLRVSSSTGDINKTVQLLHITIEDSNAKKFSAKLVPVKIAKPAEEVIDFEKIEAEKLAKENFEKFMENLTDVEDTDVHESDIFVALDNYAEHNNLDKDILDDIKERVAKAQEEVERDEE